MFDTKSETTGLLNLHKGCKRASTAQRRYLQAIETLARVRKLARNTSALQVNIATKGGQQVNVGGDLSKRTDRD